MLWWIDLGWRPEAHPATPSLLLNDRTERENKMKELLGQDKDEEITYQLLSLNLGKINLINFLLKRELDGEKQRQKLKHLPRMLILFFPGSTSLRYVLDLPCS